MTAAAYGCHAKTEIIHGYPVTVNNLNESEKAIIVAQNVIGKKFVKTNLAPSMGAEDFAYMLEKKSDVMSGLVLAKELKAVCFIIQNMILMMILFLLVLRIGKNLLNKNYLFIIACNII